MDISQHICNSVVFDDYCYVEVTLLIGTVFIIFCRTDLLFIDINATAV